MSFSVIKATGLFTTPNKLSSAPDGALAVADNVVIKHEGVIEPRRGQEEVGANIGSSNINVVTFFNDGKVVQYGTSSLAGSLTGDSTYVSYGTHTPVDATLLRMKFAQSNNNLYFNTSTGTKMTTGVTTVPVDAGVARALDPSGSLSGNPNATGAWFLANTRVAYRVCLGTKDANNNLKLSAPSGRCEIINPADESVSLTRSSNIVAATFADGSANFSNGDIIAITGSGGAGTFGAGPFTLTSGAYDSATYSETGANEGPNVARTMSSGLKKVALSARLPYGTTVANFIQVYRSSMSPLASVPAEDEMFQVYEANLTAAQVAAGVFTWTDSTPESQLFNVPLYTNPRTGNGIVDANFQPPIGKDLNTWQDRLWWGNTTGKHRYTLQLVGTGSPLGLTAQDVIVIGGEVFMYRDIPGAGYHDYFASQDRGTVSGNILVCARALINKINSLSLAFKAYYVSGENDAPGKILIEERDIGGSPFYIGAEPARAGAWNPVPPGAYSLASGTRTGSTVTLTTAGAVAHNIVAGQQIYLATNVVDANYAEGVKTVVTTPSASTLTYTETGTTAAMTGAGDYYLHAITSASDNNRQEHGLAYSKFQEPEAVPLTNYLYVGSRNKPILRIFPSKDKLFVFKEDGIYLVSGQAPYFRVDPLDYTTRLLNADSVAEVSNQIFAYTNQGIVAITEAGVSVMSRPIENELVRHTATTNTQLYSWGCSHESERMYLFGLASTSAHATEIYVYSVLANAWTRWPIARRFAAVDPATDRLNLAQASGQRLLVDRRAYTYADYAEGEAFAVTYTTSDRQNLTLNTVAEMAVGGALWNGTNGGVITAINGLVVTLSAASAGLALSGSLTYSDGIAYAVEYVAVHGGAPGSSKQFREVNLHFGKLNASEYRITTRTDLATTATASAPSANSHVYTYAAEPTEQVHRRILVPLEKQRGSLLRVGFTLTEAHSAWTLHGFSVETDSVSQRTAK